MNQASEPFVNIVTPVYNMEKYLPECIESVLAQTYQNWEYLIVDNRSTDRSLEIARQFADRDSRIRIHTNEVHLELLPNLNHALRLISPESKYCKVIHADDWLFPNCVAEMVAVAEANPTVGIVGSYRLDETLVNCDGLSYPSTVVPGREICRATLFKKLYLFGSPSTLLIRCDPIRTREFFYNESNLHSDNEACYDILQDYDFGFVHQVLTFTRRHNETNTTFARRFYSYILGDLTALKKYGPVYLDAEEYKRVLARRLKNYYRFLGKSVFQRKGRAFWDYHKKGLKDLGYPLNLLKLFQGAIFFLYNRLLDALKIKP